MRTSASPIPGPMLRVRYLGVTEGKSHELLEAGLGGPQGKESSELPPAGSQQVEKGFGSTQSAF